VKRDYGKSFIGAGVVVERVGEQLLFVVPGHTEVVSLSGATADFLSDIQAGKSVDPHNPVVSDLRELGILSVPGLSRRGLIKAGANGDGAGFTVLAMPSAAMAVGARVFPDPHSVELCAVSPYFE